MPALRLACGAFLVAVLVCDLSFDLPVLRAPSGDPRALDRALAAVTAYYERITHKGSLLAVSVALVMAALLGSLGYEGGHWPPAYGAGRFLLESSLAVVPIAVANLHTFPRARRLGVGDLPARAALARGIARDHIVMLPLMLAYVAIQLWRC